MVGDVVIAPIHYTDLSGSKPRPAIVLAEVGMSDWILCQVTSSPEFREREIVLSTNDLAIGQLKQQSWVRPDRLFTLNESVFHQTVARLTNAKLTEVLTATRALFQPPAGP